MTDVEVTHLATQALLMGVKLAAPILLASLVVGLTVSLFQSVTQLQEVTLTFVPKLAAIALVLLFSGHWMLSQFIGYVQQLFGHVTTLVGS
ncbi:MAG: flagellar biosynthetic protein FliQ [Actinomycetota bacterium]|nr:flagellar biosynthetic protein FliQ [Actinomycetota bacterium]MDA8280877.1 flagellar biosynthetic protein FliQ [Actinomycetota bacterium]